MERIITKSFARLMGRGTHRGFITHEELNKSLGKRNLGKVFLFHITANNDWSNLPISSLFAGMLQRIILLSEKNKKSVLIPKGFAHGYLSLDNANLVYFQNSTYRDKNQEKGILWNDPSLNVKLPIKKPLISKKDQLNMSLKSFQINYKHL